MVPQDGPHLRQSSQCNNRQDGNVTSANQHTPWEMRPPGNSYLGGYSRFGHWDFGLLQRGVQLFTTGGHSGLFDGVHRTEWTHQLGLGWERGLGGRPQVLQALGASDVRRLGWYWGSLGRNGWLSRQLGGEESRLASHMQMRSETMLNHFTSNIKELILRCSYKYASLYL